MKSTDTAGWSESLRLNTRYYKEFTVYIKVLQLHMMKWMDDEVRKRLKRGSIYENRDLFKSV